MDSEARVRSGSCGRRENDGAPKEAPISFEEAVRTIGERVGPTGRIETLPVGDAVGRVLAEDLTADTDYPPFDRSLMDGFAVRSADATEATTRLRVVDFLPAGAVPETPIGAGEAARIMTGAPLPPGADAVVRLEDATADGRDPVGGEVEIRGPIESGTHVRPRGSDKAAGAAVVAKGTRISPLHVAVAASVGAARLRVFERPHVRVISTGDELVPASATPGPGQIRDSNGPMVASLAREASARVIDVGSVGDDAKALEDAVGEGLGGDVLIMTGGVSVGDRDRVADTVSRAGARIVFHRVAMRPGWHLLFALAGRTSIFGLPGNPVSAYVGFRTLVRPAMRILQGEPPSSGLAWIGTAGTRLTGSPRATVFVPVAARRDRGDTRLCAVRTGGSGDPFGASQADAFVRIPPGRVIEVGDAAEGFWKGGL